MNRAVTAALIASATGLCWLFIRPARAAALRNGRRQDQRRPGSSSVKGDMANRADSLASHVNLKEPLVLSEPVVA